MKVITIFFIIISFSFSQSYKTITENKIISILPSYKNFKYKKFELEKSFKKEIENKVRQRFFRDKLYTWQICTSNDTLYVVVDNVIGKVQPITFLCIFKNDFTVYFVEILKYREAYGGEVKRRKFLEQYESKNNMSDFGLGTGVKNIAGATISVKSLNKGVHKLLLLLPKIKEAYENY